MNIERILLDIAIGMLAGLGLCALGLFVIFAARTAFKFAGAA